MRSKRKRHRGGEKKLKLTDLKIPGLSINTFVFGFVFMRFIVLLKDIPVIPLLTKRACCPSLQVSLIQPPQKCQRSPVMTECWKDEMSIELSFIHFYIYLTLYFMFCNFHVHSAGVLSGKSKMMIFYQSLSFFIFFCSSQKSNSLTFAWSLKVACCLFCIS